MRPLDKPELGGVLKLGGALQPPDLPVDKFETWDDPFPRPLQEDLSRLVNLADDYQAAGDPDPIITPPLYGTWHALTNRVLKERDGTAIVPNDNWVHRLNLDPRFRVAAGIGTRVIEDQQEIYMDAAWEQVGKVLDAQRRIRFGQFSLQASQIWYDRHLMPMLGVSQQKTLLLMAPLNKRVLSGGVTVFHTMSESFTQPAMTSAALRRAIRPRGRLIQSLPFDAVRKPDQLLARVNEGEVSAAPPKGPPPGVVTADKAADAVLPSDAPPAVVDWLRRLPQLPVLALLAAILIAFFLLVFLPPLLGIGFAAVAVAGGVFLYRRLTRWNDALRASDSIRETNQTPESVDRLPTSSNFVISDLGFHFCAAAWRRR